MSDPPTSSLPLIFYGSCVGLVGSATHSPDPTHLEFYHQLRWNVMRFDKVMANNPFKHNFCYMVGVGWRRWWPTTSNFIFFFYLIKTNAHFFKFSKIRSRSLFNKATISPGIWLELARIWWLDFGKTVPSLTCQVTRSTLEL